MEQVASLSFQVEGEFITNLARQWFWDEDKDYEKVEELLLSCLCTDQISLDQKKAIAQSIIEGRQKLVGLNEFTLEEDGKKVRPIYQKIKQLKDKAKIKEIKEDMEIHPFNYIDIFSTVNSYEDLRKRLIDYEEYFSYEDVVLYFATYSGDEDSPYIAEYSEHTRAGLWLLENPKIVFEVMGDIVCQSNKDEFFEKLYEYLKEHDKTNRYSKRQKRYEQFLRVDLTKEEEKLPAYKKEDYRFDSPDINYYKHPDDLLEEYGWINRYGEWYSCDFGGHQCKAQTIVTGNEKIQKDFDAWLEEKGTYEKQTGSYGNGKTYEYGTWFVPLYGSETWKVSGHELYQEYLLQKGWIKFHNPSGGECFPQKYLKPTREQLDTMFKSSMKRGYHKIQGLDEE